MNIKLCIILIVVICSLTVLGSVRRQEPFETEHVDLVVARYKENITWLKDVFIMPNITRVYLYNKGHDNIDENIKSHPKLVYRVLENKGREADTYIQHILSQYDTLGDKTIFCQGDPFDQAPDLYQFLQNSHLFDTVYQPISSIWFIDQGVPPLQYFNDHATPFGNSAKVLEIEMYLDTLENVGFMDPGIESLRNQYQASCHLDLRFGDGYIQNVTQRYNIPIKLERDNVGKFHYGAIFAVPRQSIQKHGKELYKRLQTYIDECRLSAYIMERLWAMMFRADPLDL